MNGKLLIHFKGQTIYSNGPFAAQYGKTTLDKVEDTFNETIVV